MPPRRRTGTFNLKLLLGHKPLFWRPMWPEMERSQIHGPVAGFLRRLSLGNAAPNPIHNSFSAAAPVIGGALTKKSSSFKLQERHRAERVQHRAFKRWLVDVSRDLLDPEECTLCTTALSRVVHLLMALISLYLQNC